MWGPFRSEVAEAFLVDVSAGGMVGVGYDRMGIGRFLSSDWVGAKDGMEAEKATLV